MFGLIHGNANTLLLAGARLSLRRLVHLVGIFRTRLVPRGWLFSGRLLSLFATVEMMRMGKMTRGLSLARLSSNKMKNKIKTTEGKKGKLNRR